MTPEPTIDSKTLCSLCNLPVGSHPFVLTTATATFAFCCEGCQGIYQMLHDIGEAPAQDQA